MLNLQPVPREAQLDIDLCRTCRDSCGWALVESFEHSVVLRDIVPLMVWIPCPDCNRDESKPKPWDA